MAATTPVPAAAPARPAPLAAAVATITLAAAGLYAALLLALHVLEPELDPRWRFISEYALGRVGWVMTLTFALIAVALIGACLTVLPHVRLAGWIGILILVVAAAGMVVAAAFPTDPMTSPVADHPTATFTGQMHELGASLDYSPVGMLLISISLARHPAWRSRRAILFATAGVALVLTVAFVAVTVAQRPADGVFGPGTIAGLVGRLLILSYAAWLVPLAAHAIALALMPLRQTPQEGPPHPD